MSIPPSRSATESMRLKFHHGLGDTLMFRSVIAALNRPVELFLLPGLGQEAIFHGDDAVRVTTSPSDPAAFREIRFPMEGSMPCRGGAPTKVRICLEHEFGLIVPEHRIRPLALPDLASIENDAVRTTRAFLHGFERYAVCHFQGTWAPDVQNPDVAFSRRTVEFLVRCGLGVVVVNYDYAYHNPLNRELDFIDGDRVRSTYRRLPMAFESLWHLLRRCSLFVGVVSGPLHAAACMDIPTVCLRKGSNFQTDFYDEGIEHVSIVDVDKHAFVPPRLVRERIERTT
ncbi:MAG: hypothetical protein ACKVWV_13945 [Planctomycetota bacterium]